MIKSYFFQNSFWVAPSPGATRRRGQGKRHQVWLRREFAPHPAIRQLFPNPRAVQFAVPMLRIFVAA